MIPRSPLWLTLTALLLLPARLPAQSPPTPDSDAATAQTACETELEAGRHTQALPVCQVELRVAEQRLGSEHESVGHGLLNVGRALRGVGKYAEAIPLVQRALRILQKVRGDQHSDVGESLNDLALLYKAQGQYAQAEPLLKRSLSLFEKARGLEHPDVATLLNNLAALHDDQGQYAQAEPLYKRSLDIREKALGPGHPDIAVPLNNLAELHRAQGQYAQAEPLYKRSLDIREKALGPGHPDVAQSLNNLAGLYEVQGQYAQAETLHRRSLGLREKALGPAHPDVATSLNNLAGLYLAQGQYAQAEPLYKRSLDIREKALGPGHPLVAVSLNNLAGLTQIQGQYVQAGKLLERSLGLLEKALGSGHPHVATCLNNLAVLYQAQGQYVQAESLHKRSLALREKALGPEHPLVAASLHNLAVLYQAQGQYANAERLLKSSLDLLERAVGPNHPDVAMPLNRSGMLYLSSGRQAQALPLLHQAASIREAQLRATVSEVRMQALLDTLRGEEDLLYGLLLGPKVAGAKELALQVALLRKGRVLAAGAAANQVVQRSLGTPEIAEQFQKWQGVRQQHEALVYGGLGKLSPAEYQRRLHDTKLRAEALEAQLASALPALRSLQPPKQEEIVAKVAAKLPAGSALVEVVWTRPYQGTASADGQRWGTPHYVALILFPDRRIEVVDLGEAATVDTLELALRTALSSPGMDPVTAARALDRQVMGRLRERLGGVRDLYLSLDGTLNEVPFDALHDGMDYLLGRYRFHYLTSGRDLLRERSPREASTPLVLADPAFGAVEAGVGAQGSLSLYPRLAGLAALPGTVSEAQAIARLLGIEPLLGPRAREEAVRGHAAPRILHIATHGLFLQDVERAPPQQSGELHGFVALQRERSKLVGAAEAERLPGAPGAMNRSALVLADAARGANAKDTAADGLLTAEEARSLDLDGTQLVVLSACETGRGGLSAGQGVYGLRRAFLVAGAETLVTSLWRVSDAATGELMTAYYQKLLDKQQPGDRLGAMVDAMQELRAKPGRAHPYYWAPFLVIGSAGPLRAPAH